MKQAFVVELISILFVILFLYTGISKLLEFDIFREQIGVSPILRPFAPILTWALPITEFGISLMLMIPIYRTKALYGSLVLMSIFTIYVISLLVFDDNLPCSCGGLIGLMSW